jgi:hypothetical protein
MQDSSFWQVNAWKAAVFGALLTAFLAVVQAITATVQRRRELRWKKAETGRDLLDKVLAEPLSNAALLMLDSEERDYQVTEQTTMRISATDMLTALRVPQLPKTQMHEFIRDAFDTLYYYLDRMEHFIRVGLTSFEDISSPLDYYIDYLAEDKEVHLAYIGITRYTRVREFLDRFENWRTPQPVNSAAPAVGLPAARTGIGSSSKAPRPGDLP